MTTALQICRRLPIGAEIAPHKGVHFRIWAPKRHSVDAVLFPPASHSGTKVQIPLQPEGNGYFSAFAHDAVPGTRYGFRLDNGDQLRPDPASRFQPDGPSGLSEVVDPHRFSWSDQSWEGLQPPGQVLYEMHIGTFTSQGTWQAAAGELAELARLGITVVEVLPVADFSGRFGWGYDGVNLFAPTRLYGTPDDFRQFVNQAHVVGLGVILDVVYNHFGVSENWIREFADSYNTDRYESEWSEAINFDGKNSRPVREFFKANACYWIDEFHLDGFRFDATQAIHDASTPHVLAEISIAARKAAGEKSLYLIAENEAQDVRTVCPAEKNGHGMDAAWNDDFHHAACVRLTGHNPAYYSDYWGSAEELIAAAKRGFIYQGQRSQWQKKPRGTSAIGLPATAFISFLQNHDQVANSATGERIDRLTSPGKLRAMTALWLLAPQTPLFFQGQEFAATSPFLFFADYSGELGAAVARGRAKFLSQFPNLGAPEAQRNLPNPTDPATFRRCKLDLNERQSHRPIYNLHADLLRLRREDPVFAQQRPDRIDGVTLGADGLLLRYFGENGDDRLLLVNFGGDFLYSPAPQPLLAPPAGYSWASLWSSEDLRYGGVGTAPIETDEGWHIRGESASVLFAKPSESK